jgi:hypothetical protein
MNQVLNYTEFVKLLEAKRPRINQVIVKMEPEKTKGIDNKLIYSFNDWTIEYSNNVEGHSITKYISDRAELPNVETYNDILTKTLISFDVRLPMKYDIPRPTKDDTRQYVLVFRGIYNFQITLAKLNIEEKFIRISTILDKDQLVRDKDILLYRYDESIETIDKQEIIGSTIIEEAIIIDIFVTK